MKFRIEPTFGNSTLSLNLSTINGFRVRSNSFDALRIIIAPRRKRILTKYSNNELISFAVYSEFPTHQYKFYQRIDR